MSPTTVAWPKLRRGLVAILRGLKPDEAVAVGTALVEAGFEALEVPLNSPEPLRSIELLAGALGKTAWVGAGTVLTPAQVDAVAEAGGQLIVSPNVDASVIRATVVRRLISMPGVFTPTEALAAIAAGASGLKFFPASALGAGGINAIRAVLPAGVPIAAVGGVGEADFIEYATAGVSAFGIGSSLYKPGASAADVRKRAVALVAAYDAAFGKPAAASAASGEATVKKPAKPRARTPKT